MDTSYLGILSLGGVLVAPVLSGFVYLDTARRSLSSSKRLLLATAFGVISFGGFLVPYVYRDQLSYAYLHVIKPRPVLISPYEWTTVGLVTGILISTILGFLYFVGVRYAPVPKE